MMMMQGPGWCPEGSGMAALPAAPVLVGSIGREIHSGCPGWTASRAMLHWFMRKLVSYSGRAHRRSLSLMSLGEPIQP